MFKKLQMTDMDAFSALPIWLRFEDENHKKPSYRSPNFFHEFCTRPLFGTRPMRPVWLWNLLTIVVLIALGRLILAYALGLYLIVFILWIWVTQGG